VFSGEEFSLEALVLVQLAWYGQAYIHGSVCSKSAKFGDWSVRPNDSWQPAGSNLSPYDKGVESYHVDDGLAGTILQGEFLYIQHGEILNRLHKYEIYRVIKTKILRSDQ